MANKSEDKVMSLILQFRDDPASLIGKIVSFRFEDESNVYFLPIVGVSGLMSNYYPSHVEFDIYVPYVDDRWVIRRICIKNMRTSVVRYSRILQEEEEHKIVLL